MKNTIFATSVLAVLSILLSACNLQAANPTQISPDQINTIAAQTVEALTTQMAPPPATATNTPEPTTATPAVTETPTLLIPTLNLSPVATLGLLPTNTLLGFPTSVGSSTCNAVYFVSDDTIPDNTVIAPGATFVKKWTIKNNGSCTWTTLYTATMFDNAPADPAITGDGTFTLKGNVAPGGLLQIVVNLKAPKQEGTYVQTWKMQTGEGDMFGDLSQGGWYVKIKVSKSGGTSSSEGVTGTTISVSDNGDGTFDLSGTIDVAGAFHLVAYWKVDGDKVGSNFVKETHSGTYTMPTTTYTCPNGGDKDVQIYISQPGAGNVTGLASDVVPCP